MTLKAPPFTVFRRIVFPLTLPGVVIGQVLVFLNVMADFATVRPSAATSIALLPNLVLTFYEGSQIRAASVVAVLLMLCMLAGVAVAMRVVDVRRLGSTEMDGSAGIALPPPRNRSRRFDHRARSRLTAWVLGTLTVAFLLYQWLPIFTLSACCPSAARPAAPPSR